MDISIIEKVKSRKLAAVVLIGAQFVRMDAPYEAYLYLGLGYLAAEAFQMAAEKIAEALKPKTENPKSEIPSDVE